MATVTKAKDAAIEVKVKVKKEPKDAVDARVDLATKIQKASDGIADLNKKSKAAVGEWYWLNGEVARLQKERDESNLNPHLGLLPYEMANEISSMPTRSKWSSSQLILMLPSPLLMFRRA